MPKPPVNQEPPRLSLATGLALLASALLLTAAGAVLISLDLLPRGNEQWSWPLRTPPSPVGTAALAALLGAVLAGLLVGDRLRAPQPPTARQAAALVLLLVLLAALLLGAVALHDPLFPVIAPLVVMSDLAIGYYTTAAQLPDPTAAFRGHVARATDPQTPDRVRTHPPGPILLMMAVRAAVLSRPDLLARVEAALQARYGLTAEDLLRAARGGTAVPLSRDGALAAVVVAWLLTLLPALLVAPVYGLGAALADRRVGLTAAALSAALPSVLCFVAGINGPGAVAAVTTLWLWAAALRSGRWSLYALAGLAGAITLLWSYGYLALGLVALAPVVCSATPTGRPRLLGTGLVFCLAAMAVVYGVLDAVCGYNLPAALSESLGAQAEILAREGRDYLSWLALNPYSFLLFCGPALLVAAGAARSRAGRPPTPVRAVGVALILTLLVLVVSGATRAEVERIWVFLMPLLTLPAASVLVRFPPRLGMAGPVVILGAQVVWALALAGHWALVTPY